MLFTPHAATGAAIGALVSSPAAAVPLALASHYMLDVVPHWQETLPPYTPHLGTWIRIPIDVALGLGLVALIARSRRDRARIIAGAIAGVVPDIDTLLLLVPRDVREETLIGRYLHWHTRIQRETASLWGLVPQVGLALLSLGLTRRRGNSYY